MGSRFRPEYRALSDDEKANVHNIKVFADGLADMIDGGAPDGREKALALTKLEEAVMWAVKAVTG